MIAHLKVFHLLTLIILVKMAKSRKKTVEYQEEQIDLKKGIINNIRIETLNIYI